MKAKEYVARYHAARASGATEHEAVSAMLIGLTEEAVRIGLQRSDGRFQTTERLAMGVIREQDLKWRSIAYALGFNPNGFRDVLKDKGITF